MKVNSSQLYDCETLMDLADGTLPEAESGLILKDIRESEADVVVLKKLIASAAFVELIRKESSAASAPSDILNSFFRR